MIQRIKWVDRGFDFSSPPGMYPNFIERLRGMPARIEAIIRFLSEQKLVDRKNNNWSIKEHIGHITDLEEIHVKRLDQLLSGIDTLLPADMTNKKTYLSNHNETDTIVLIDQLNSARHAFVERLASVEESDITKSALHPRLNKQMRIVDLAYFVAEHDDHHITIIRELAEIQQ